MKYLLYIFLSFHVVNLHAQSLKTTEIEAGKNSLSSEELEIAKKLYTNMMVSETYLNYKKENNQLKNNLNGINVFPTKEDYRVTTEGDTGDKSIDAFYKKRLAENLKKTKFKTVEEGFNMIKKVEKLFAKKLEENATLYNLLKKATPLQRRQIQAPEFEMFFNK